MVRAFGCKIHGMQDARNSFQPFHHANTKANGKRPMGTIEKQIIEVEVTKWVKLDDKAQHSLTATAERLKAGHFLQVPLAPPQAAAPSVLPVPPMPSIGRGQKRRFVGDRPFALALQPSNLPPPRIIRLPALITNPLQLELLLQQGEQIAMEFARRAQGEQEMTAQSSPLRSGMGDCFAHVVLPSPPTDLNDSQTIALQRGGGGSPSPLAPLHINRMMSTAPQTAQAASPSPSNILSSLINIELYSTADAQKLLVTLTAEDNWLQWHHFFLVGSTASERMSMGLVVAAQRYMVYLSAVPSIYYSSGC